MPNTLSPEFLPATDRAMVRYLSQVFGHFSNAIDQAIDLIVHGDNAKAIVVLDLLADVATETEEKGALYLEGAPSKLEVKYHDEAELPVIAPAPEALDEVSSPINAELVPTDEAAAEATENVG